MQSNLAEHTLLSNSSTVGVALELESVSKSFGAREVLKSLSLSVLPGQFLAIVGRSGCGKSTLLRLLAGLETAESGAVRCSLNLSVDRSHPEIRMMFQDSRLLPWKKVEENISLGIRRSRKQESLKILNDVGLSDRQKDWPSALSGGQRQRVALARALVHDPDLLLLDEPLGALDALTRIEMQQLIESLWQRRGFTAVLVTHDVQKAIALADRVVLIEDGQIALDRLIPLSRPRSRGNPDFAKLEQEILDRVLGQEDLVDQQPSSETVRL